jgi:hypothetical protein
VREAVDHLACLPPSPPVEALAQLAEQAIRREA